MSVVGMVETTERPPFARFERRGLEDRNESIKQGRYIERDVDHALITPPGSRDVFVTIASEWFTDLRKQADDGRIPRAWYDRYVEQYERWKQGEELPVNGIPIKGWAVLSPAQQKNLIGVNIYTVEDLSKINDEGLRRVGMGALDLKNKAIAWLRQVDDKGGLTQENAALKSENESLKAQLQSLSDKVDALVRDSGKTNPVAINEPVSRPALDDEDSIRQQYTEKFGKVPHHKMKLETIIEHLKG